VPANVTPQYEKAEQRYREAATDPERLEALREMYSTLPKHKGTEKMQADIKRRISQLSKAMATKGPSKGQDVFHVPRGGAGQVLLLGPPNVGKSHLVATTTNAPVKVADYPFTTTLPTPGMWPYEDVQIQLVDTPPVTAEHMPAGLMGTVNASDIIAVVVDASADLLEQAEMVLNLLTGRGLVLRSLPRHQLDAQDPRQRSGLIVANKVDLAPAGSVLALRELYGDRLEVLAVSAATGEGLDVLAKKLWALLAVVRVYTKEPGRGPDRDKPYTLPAGSTLTDLARKIHRELPEKMKFARVWGDGRFSGQQVHRAEPLRDKDVVEIHE